MIQGGSVSGSGGRAGEDSEARGAARRVEGEARGAALGRAHPYHWAPFVLMGNWR